MANKEHLYILNQGVKQWNNQIKNNWFIPDLRGADLSGTKLNIAKLNNADLGGANLGGTDLGGAELCGANLIGANLSGADLFWADLSNANLNSANLNSANLNTTNLKGADLTDADLTDANLRNTEISSSTKLKGKWRKVWEIVNQGAKNQDLSHANLYRANLSGANLSGANLFGANLNDANLNNADLSGADLRYACLNNTKLNNVDLLGANLKNTYLGSNELDPKWRKVWEIVNQKVKSNNRSLLYEDLEYHLKNGRWQEADGETYRLMTQVMGKDEDELLTPEEIKNFPCDDLRIINKLWLKYSNGKFGLSVQKEIYESLGGTAKFSYDIWENFCDRVGWIKELDLRKEGGPRWRQYTKYKSTFNLNVNKAHLPMPPVPRYTFQMCFGWGIVQRQRPPRMQQESFCYLLQRLLNCEI